jgi:hypothetical protein
MTYVSMNTNCKTNCETFVHVDRYNTSHKLAEYCSSIGKWCIVVAQTYFSWAPYFILNHGNYHFVRRVLAIMQAVDKEN